MHSLTETTLKNRDEAKINGRDDRGVKNVLICPHGLDVSRNAHGNFSQKTNCLVAVAPSFCTRVCVRVCVDMPLVLYEYTYCIISVIFTFVASYVWLLWCLTSFNTNRIHVTTTNMLRDGFKTRSRNVVEASFATVAGFLHERKWHLPWLLLDMQHVQISLDLPFPEQINSDTLGSVVHPIVPAYMLSLHWWTNLKSVMAFDQRGLFWYTYLRIQVKKYVKSSLEGTSWISRDAKELGVIAGKWVCIILLRQSSYEEQCGTFELFRVIRSFPWIFLYLWYLRTHWYSHLNYANLQFQKFLWSIKNSVNKMSLLEFWKEIGWFHIILR